RNEIVRRDRAGPVKPQARVEGITADQMNRHASVLLNISTTAGAIAVDAADLHQTVDRSGYDQKDDHGDQQLKKAKSPLVPHGREIEFID
ncbi:MAG TPA: hypothetical protein PKE66_06105, partial [Pyrinomonadaceae bacterium]|nr:hypothetical protein [Pyrinomonadaceae bacterium]